VKLRLLAVGTRLPGWVHAACSDYSKRFASDLKFELVEVPLAQRGLRADIARAVAREGEKMLGAIRADDFVVALDVSGKTMSTTELAAWLSARTQEGRDLAFLIGGPEGLARACLDRANLRLSLSTLTFPHSLARVMLVEQLYRAYSLGKGHPYHRAGNQ
jgi:23S rRNA (pseudouridine1915-N3)-methyltransferase